jgi:sphingolipid delta-4 desaturase
VDYLHTDYREPHRDRARRLLRDHPEVKELAGHLPLTFAFILGVVALQVTIAFALAAQPWWVIVAAAWLVGAFADHALWTLIHECTHNLVFRSSRANALAAIVANLPIVFPAAISFRKYHLLHHAYQGDTELDADLAAPWEARLVGSSFVGKALWELFFFAFQALRVQRLPRVQFLDGWYLFNAAVQVAFATALVLAGGWPVLAYVTLSSVFSIGLHPLGARWIQEHYLVAPPQETYSYYGPLNRVAFNVGYHNEHHDAMRVPWLRLPRVRALAPELYDGLVSHRSWTRLWLKFLLDPSLSLYSRAVRTSEVAGAPPRIASTAQAEARAGELAA